MERLKIFLYEEVNIKLLEEQKLVIAKIFAYILTRDYSNSKTLKKKKKKNSSLVEIVVRNLTCGIYQRSLNRNQYENMKSFLLMKLLKLVFSMKTSLGF